MRNVYPGGPYIGEHKEAIDAKTYHEPSDARVLRETHARLLRTQGLKGLAPFRSDMASLTKTGTVQLRTSTRLSRIQTSADLRERPHTFDDETGKEQYFLHPTVKKVLALDEPHAFKNEGKSDIPTHVPRETVHPVQLPSLDY